MVFGVESDQLLFLPNVSQLNCHHWLDLPFGWEKTCSLLDPLLEVQILDDDDQKL